MRYSLPLNCLMKQCQGETGFELHNYRLFLAAHGDDVRRPDFTLYLIALPLEQLLDGPIEIGLSESICVHCRLYRRKRLFSKTQRPFGFRGHGSRVTARIGQKMKLHYAWDSPYVHKVMLVAHECGLMDQLELLPTTVETVIEDVRGDNPLGQIPTLITDDGTVLYDSFVIMEYLDHRAGCGLLPPPGPARWLVLRHHALGHGMIDTIHLRFHEMLRPANQQSRALITKKETEARRTFEALEAEAKSARLSPEANLGTLTIACALAYAERRWSEGQWPLGRPALAAWYEHFAARPSMRDSAAPPE